MIRRQKIYTLEPRDSTIGLWRFRDNLEGEYPNTDLTPRHASLKFDVGRSEDGITGLIGGGGTGDGAYLPAADATAFDFGTDSVTIEIVANIYDPYVDWPLRKMTAPNTGFVMGLSIAPHFAFVVMLGDGTQLKTFISDQAFEEESFAWFHFAVVVDRDNDLLRIYIDGTEDANSPLDISGLGSISAPAADFEFIETFRGVLDEVCISEEVLTPAAIAERVAGKWVDMRTDEDGFMISQLPDILFGNPDFDEFLKPFDLAWGDIRQRTIDLARITRWNECPDYLLEDFVSLYGFELISINHSSPAIRSGFIQAIPWIYLHKGVAAVAVKFIELLEFTGTVEDALPPWIPFVLNHHRTFERSQFTIVDFSDNFSSHNLSLWNRQLSFDAWWRLSIDPDGTGHLRGTGDGTVAATNSILFDINSDAERYAVAFDILDGYGPSTEFGLYLRYDDEDNFIRVVIATSAGGVDELYLEKNLAGVPTTSSVVDVSSMDHEIGVHTLTVFFNSANQSYVVALDDVTLIYDETLTSSGISDAKKGLWVGRDLTVEFNSVTVDHLDPALMSKIYSDDFSKRRLVITITNEPDSSAERMQYLQKVLPLYMPFGVELAWARPIAAVTAKAVADGAVVGIGFIFAGVLGASAKAVADGAVATKSSVTIVPPAATAKAVATLNDIVIDVGAVTARAIVDNQAVKIGYVFIGARGASAKAVADGIRLITKLDPGNAGAGWKDNETTPLVWGSLTVEADLTDGNKSVQAMTITASTWMIGDISTLWRDDIVAVKLYDTYSSEPDGLNASFNRLALYIYNGSDPLINMGTFTASRKGQVTTITFPVITTCKSVNVWAIDGGLKSSDGTLLQFAEIEVYRLK